LFISFLPVILAGHTGPLGKAGQDAFIFRAAKQKAR